MSNPDFKAFSNAIIDMSLDTGVDALDVQEAAVLHGLLEPKIMPSRCGEGCRCAEVDAFPLECYWKAYKVEG